MTAVKQQPIDSHRSRPSVPRLNLEGLDSDEDAANRQPHPLDLIDSYDFDASGKDTGIGPSFHSGGRSLHAEAPIMSAVRSDSPPQKDENSGRTSSQQPPTDDGEDIPVDLANPEDVQQKLATVNFTEEEEEELLQQAYEMNKLLRQRLTKLVKTEKKRAAGRGSPATLQRAKTMYEGSARIGQTKKLPPLPRQQRPPAGGSRPPLPHPPTQPKKLSTKQRQARSVENSAVGRRVPRPEWNDRFTAEA